MSPRMTVGPVYSVDRLPGDPDDWKQYQNMTLTSAVRLSHPFAVQTTEGLVYCNDGYLAIDSRGYPYPIAAEEFDRIYNEHFPESK